MNPKEFCSCTDHKCPFNPVNHDKGAIYVYQNV